MSVRSIPIFPENWATLTENLIFVRPKMPNIIEGYVSFYV